MNKRTGIIVAIIAVLVTVAAVVVLSHNSKDMKMPISSSSSNSQNAVATSTVTIQNYNFSPSTIKVKVGTTVTWTNQDDVSHTVNLDSGSVGPNSKPLSKGQSYSYTYKSAGTFNYHCGIHPDMHGSVIVTT